MAQKNNRKSKCLSINLTTYVQDPYVESHKTLMKQIKEDLNKWRYLPCSWTGRFNSVKYFQLDLQHTSSQNPSKLFCRYQQIYSKVYMGRQKTIK